MQDPQDFSLAVKLGDLVVTPHAFPLADYIVQASRDSQLLFYPYHVEQLLKFLEDVVLYDRIVVATCQVESPFAVLVQQGDVFERNAPGKIISEHVPVADLSDPLYDQLRAAGVLVETLIASPESSSRDLFDKQLASSEIVRRRVNEQEERIRNDVSDPDLRRELALLITWAWVGRPLYIAEAARVAAVPHELAWWEAKQVEPVEREDRRTLRSLLSRLSTHTNEAARAELRRIQSLGGRTLLPETPIAWQILSNATNATDLATVALQLRTEYAHVRSHVQTMESELRSDDVTVKRKAKIVDELNQVILELSPSQRRGFRRELVESVSVVAAFPTQVPSSIPAAASAIGSLLALPVDTLLRAFRYRRYRVLFRTKRIFLKAKGADSKLAAVFGISLDTVHKGLAKHASREGTA